LSPLARIGSSACLVTLIFAIPIAARAQARPSTPDGTVIAIDSGDLVVDIGAAKGVREDDLVELWRPLRIRHPVTGQVLVDRFRIGSLRLKQVRSALSLASVEGNLTRPPATGDLVVLAEGPREAPRVVAAVVPLPANANANANTNANTTVVRAVVPPSSPPVVVDPDGLALGNLMVALTGSEPAMRVQAYETFVRAHPSSRFAKVLREEVAQLRPAPAPDRRYQVSVPALEHVRAGEPQRFAVELDAMFVGAVVHVRHKGAPGYRSVPMESVGPRYWAATLPGDEMRDGGMEYFVEGVMKEKPAVALVGTADAPRAVEVDTPPGAPRPVGTLAQVTLQSEYASFNVKRANDYVWQTEGSVGWRLHEEGIRAVRSGFGVLRGKGGNLRDLDELGRDPTSVGLTYGYVEGEVTLSPTFSLIARPILGLREQGITGGAQGFVRIGNDLRTNLAIGGEVLGTIGQRGIVQLEWRTIKRVPIVLRTEVTNQPAGSSDIGARAIAQVGYQLTDELVLAGRVSYQGRTINHAGPGTGLAVSYQW
jgi:hypothetical protein